MTTVLTIPGMGANLGWLVGRPDYMVDFYRRQCTTVGVRLPEGVAPGWAPVDAVTPVRYRNLQLLGFINGAKALDASLHQVPAGQQILVSSHSMGSYAAWVWLRDYAPTSDIDPARLRFLMAGVATDMKEAPHMIGSRYPVTDVVLQWEKYGDPATVRTRWFDAAVLNSRRLDLHTTGYQGVDLTVAPAQQRIHGAVTFVFYPTSRIAAGVEATRDEIETAYDRRYLRLSA